jgi:hypothetical protein
MQLNLRALIPLIGGIYCLLIAFRIIRVSKNPETEEAWHRKFGRLMKLMGPVLVLFGLIELFRVI